MIGFSMGDLNVTIRGSKSETVMVKCGTTKQDQIIAFKKTFGHYGRIWESKPTGSKRINTQVGLNLSFSFLLEKKEIADGWIVNNNNYFFSFLAGFSDAEGSFFQSRNQACFSLGNYNLKILKQIKNALSKYGIETPKIYTSYLEGKRNCYGYIWNSNYYLLRCSKKIHLSRLIDQLCRYAKHPGRKRDMKEAMKNIENRNNKIKNG
jgi:intein-encoded DNA endonuclease-like protein